MRRTDPAGMGPLPPARRGGRPHLPLVEGGATVVSNGQALCKCHNRSKSNLTPPWWYVVSLERRRQKYYPVGVGSASLSGASDEAARDAWKAARGAR